MSFLATAKATNWPGRSIPATVALRIVGGRCCFRFRRRSARPSVGPVLGLGEQRRGSLTQLHFVSSAAFGSRILANNGRIYANCSQADDAPSARSIAVFLLVDLR